MLREPRSPLSADDQFADELIDVTRPAPRPNGGAHSATWVLPAEITSVDELRARTVAFAQTHAISGELLDDIKLATSEALTNVVMHAFHDRVTPGLVGASIKVDRGAGRITVLVTDDGMGVSPRTDSPGLGLGLAVIARIAELTTIRPANDGCGTQVCMTFGLRGG